jgi:hypothetical protein
MLSRTISVSVVLSSVWFAAGVCTKDGGLCVDDVTSFMQQDRTLKLLKLGSVGSTKESDAVDDSVEEGSEDDSIDDLMDDSMDDTMMDNSMENSMEEFSKEQECREKSSVGEMHLYDIDPGPPLEPGVVKYPGLALNPPVKIDAFQVHHEKTVGMPPPEDYWFLDVRAILKVIDQASPNMSRWAINLGAKPQGFNNVEEFNGHVIETGDDVSILYHMGFSGINFDLSRNKEKTDAFYQKLGPKMHVAYDVFPDNIVSALQTHSVPTNPAFLKVDVDSFECEFIKHILQAGYRPLVISSEVNAVPVPPLQYSALYARDGTTYDDYVGNMLGSCSLQYMHNLIQPFGYTLIQFPLEDGWWVRNEFAHLFGKISHDPATLYRIGNPFYYGRHPEKMKKWILNPETSLAEFTELVECTVLTESVDKGFAGHRQAHYAISM